MTILQGHMSRIMEGRQPATGKSVDRDGTVCVDDAYLIEAYDDGWMVDVSIADVPAAIPADSPRDIAARCVNRDLNAPGGLYRMLPNEVRESLSLQAGKERPAITFTADIGRDGAVRDFYIHRTKFKSAGAYGQSEYNYYRQKAPGIVAGEMNLALALHHRRIQDMMDECSGVIRKMATHKCRAQDNMPFHATANPGGFVVEELMHMTSQIATTYLRRHELPFIADHYDVSMVNEHRNCRDEFNKCADGVENAIGQALLKKFSQHAKVTSPLRKYSDIVNLRTIMAHVEGQDIPHGAEQMAKFQKYHNDILVCTGRLAGDIATQAQETIKDGLAMARRDFEAVARQVSAIADAQRSMLARMLRSNHVFETGGQIQLQSERLKRSGKPSSPVLSSLSQQLWAADWRPVDLNATSYRIAGTDLCCTVISTNDRNSTSVYRAAALGTSIAQATDGAAAQILRRMAGSMPSHFTAARLAV